jgi:hypothetical protein
MSLENRTGSAHGRGRNIISFMPRVLSERFALHLHTSALRPMRTCDGSAVFVSSVKRKDADA